MRIRASRLGKMVIWRCVRRGGGSSGGARSDGFWSFEVLRPCAVLPHRGEQGRITSSKNLNTGVVYSVYFAHNGVTKVMPA